jgi:hypothetical protein
MYLTTTSTLKIVNTIFQSLVKILIGKFNPLHAELNSICKSQLAELFFFWGGGGLNFAHDFRKTWIFRELSRINLWNKKHFVGKETDIA